MLKAQIDIYSHFFKVTKVHPSIKLNVFRQTHRELQQVSFVKIRGRVQKQGVKMFASRNADGSEYRFHINYLKRFKELLRAALIQDEEIEWVTHELYEPTTVDLKMPSSIVMRDYQEDAITYIGEPGHSKLITLQTGFGKSYVALKFCERNSKRVMITVLGRYKEKWVEDVVNAYGEHGVDVHLVKGQTDLLRLIDLGLNGLPLPDVIIVTTTVMARYIKEWERHGGRELEGMVPPEALYEVLGIGVRVIDEAHQHFHSVFKLDLFTHCPKCIYLTATLDTYDNFMAFIYQVIWPKSMRTTNLKPKAYDQTVTVLYNHMVPEKIRCIGGQGYSHAMYEQSIYKHVPSWCEYLDMIGDVIEQHFLPIYEPGKKMLIFCSLVDTCVQIANYINERFKSYHFKCSKFTAEDPKEVIDTNDITVSTLGKSGTALDISGLVVCLMTVALQEPKANKQAKGRLRDLSKKEGFEHIVPKFIYFTGIDIDKHVAYHKDKVRLFSPITTKHSVEHSGYVLGESLREYCDRPGKERRDKAWGLPREQKKLQKNKEFKK